MLLLVVVSGIIHKYDTSHRNEVMITVTKDGHSGTILEASANLPTTPRWVVQVTSLRDGPLPRGTWTNSRSLTRCEPHEAQQGKVQGSTPGPHSLGEEPIKSSPAEKDLRVLVEERLDTTQARALRAKHVPGCTQSSVGSTSREGIFPFAPLWWKPTQVPRSALGPVGAGLEEATKMVRGMSTSPLRGQAQGIRVAQPGGGSWETSLQPFSTYSESIRKMGTGFLAGSVTTAWGIMIFH